VIIVLNLWRNILEFTLYPNGCHSEQSEESVRSICEKLNKWFEIQFTTDPSFVRMTAYESNKFNIIFGLKFIFYKSFSFLMALMR
jgi:hypothetical protein